MSDSSQTLDDFLRVLRASGLVDAGKIDKALAPWMDTEGRLPLGDEPVPEGLVAALIITTGKTNFVKNIVNFGMIRRRWRRRGRWRCRRC